MQWGQCSLEYYLYFASIPTTKTLQANELQNCNSCRRILRQLALEICMTSMIFKQGTYGILVHIDQQKAANDAPNRKSSQSRRYKPRPVPFAVKLAVSTFDLCFTSSHFSDVRRYTEWPTSYLMRKYRLFVFTLSSSLGHIRVFMFIVTI